MPGATPVTAGIDGPVTGGDNFSVTITMDQQVTANTTISLASSSALITGPSGAPFPSTATVPAGQSSVAVPLGCTDPPANTNVTLTASANGGSASKTFPVLAGSPP